MLVITKRRWFKNRVIHKFPRDCSIRHQEGGGIIVIAADRKLLVCLNTTEWSSYYWDRSEYDDGVGE